MFDDEKMRWLFIEKIDPNPVTQYEKVDAPHISYLSNTAMDAR
jgi:hypothetical protein